MNEPHKGPSDGVDLTKNESGEQAPFDPYRFGKPDHPIPAEYAPPGYTGPTIPSAPPSPYGTYPATPGNPFANPPGTAYAPTDQGPYPDQYPAPGPYRYGPPPPPYHGYPMPQSGNGKAIAALVFGILSIVLCWLMFFDAVFVILGLIFGIIALGETKDHRSGGRGVAIAGVVCTVVGALLATFLTVLIVRSANQCGGLENTSSQQWQTCVRENFLN